MNAKIATYQGRTVDILEKKGGWTTILDGMKQIKVRNGELTAAKEESEMPTTQNTSKRAPKAPPMTKAQAAKAAKTPAKRDRRGQAVDLKASADDGDSRLIKADLSRYHVIADVRTASGRKAIDSGDAIAQQLRGKDLTEVYAHAAKATGRPVAELQAKYKHLNPGMQRMNLGNVIRGATRAASATAH